MNILRSLGHFLAGTLLSFSLFTLVFVLGFLQLVTHPEKVKSLISESGIYQSVVSGIIEESQKQLEEEGGEEDSLPLDRPEIKQAAEQAFSPEFLQTSTEEFIDGTYRWLNGEVEKPDFRIDFTDAKSDFIDNIGHYVKERTEALPACSPNELPKEVDIFNASCVPPGLNIDAEVARVKDDLDSPNSDFLFETVITADDIAAKDGSKGAQGNVFTKDLASLPRAYQNLQLVPLFLGGMAVLSAAIIIMLSVSKHKGFKRVAITLVVAGVVLLLGILLLNLGLDKAKDAALDNQSAGAFKDKLLLLIERVGDEIKAPYLKFGLIYTVLGTLMLLTLKFIWPSHGGKVLATVKPQGEPAEQPPHVPPVTIETPVPKAEVESESKVEAATPSKLEHKPKKII